MTPDKHIDVKFFVTFKEYNAGHALTRDQINDSLRFFDRVRANESR